MQTLSFEKLPEAVGNLIQEIKDLKVLVQNNSHTDLKTQDDILTVKQAAEFLRLKVPTLYGIVQKIDETNIPVSKQGKRLYFSKKELTAWLMSGKKKTALEIEAAADNNLATTKK